jgi:hypothetical protein
MICRELQVKIPSKISIRIRPVVAAPLHAARQTDKILKVNATNLGSVPYSRDTKAGASSRILPFIYGKYTDLCPQAGVVRCFNTDANIIHVLKLLLNSPDREYKLIRIRPIMIPCSHKTFYGSDYED